MFPKPLFKLYYKMMPTTLKFAIIHPMPTKSAPTTQKSLHELEEIAVELRKSVIELLLEAGSGHSAGPLGMADVFAALYFNVLNINPDNPTDPNRDRLVLSNGHICPIFYATLAYAGFF